MDMAGLGGYAFAEVETEKDEIITSTIGGRGTRPEQAAPIPRAHRATPPNTDRLDDRR